MAVKQNYHERILHLEKEIRSLTEELSQCQADKEFVWSLWKRLQVANPDITQAISLVVDREKNKAETKDRKVLEILQVKDNKIQELELKASGQQQEINNLVLRKIAVDEENTLLKKELNDLQQQLNDKSQELKGTKESTQKKEVQNEVIIQNLEQEKEGLSKRYSDLLNDLEKARKQEAQWRADKSGTDAKIKDLEVNLKDARSQLEVLYSKMNDLSSQLAIKQTEVEQKDVDMTRLRQELQELQNLYTQSSQHAAQQAELIQQLQALNMDTQKVLRSQEDAHTTETISYQKLYNDLNACYETAKSSETQLRHSNIALTEQLHQREQQISQLQVKLQEALNALPKPPQEPQDLEHPSLIELELIIASQKSEIKFLQDKLKTADFQLTQVNNCGGDALQNSILRAGRKHEVKPVKRSRSLSPKAFTRESEELKKLKIAEKRIEHLEKTLQIKTLENAEMQKAHEKRRERLLTLQTNYREVKQQLEQCEDECSRGKGNNKRIQRADPWQLRHEDSDAVWNELAHFKMEQKKLLVEKMNLEEEIDQLNVQASADKATIQELKVCLQQEREELLFRLANDEVMSSTPKKNTGEILQQALQKVSHLEKKLTELEAESRKLRGINEELTKEKNSLKLFLIKLQKDGEARERKIDELKAVNVEANIARETLEMSKDELNKEVTALKKLLAESNKWRNENRDLLRQIQSLQSTVDQAKAVADLTTRKQQSKQFNKKDNGTKVKPRTAKKISLRRHQAFLNQSIKVMSSMFENFSKDGWEDVSEDSDTETEFCGSLGRLIAKTESTLTEEMSTVEESTGTQFSEAECDDALNQFPNKKPASGDIFAFLDRVQLPSLNSVQMEFLDAPITLEEIQSVIISLPAHKAPGPDGFSGIYYKKFAEILSSHMLQLFRLCSKKGSFPDTMLLAHISALPKPGKPPKHCQNFWPISLLNTNLKIYAKMLASRLQTILPSLLHYDQVGFIKGRQATHNTRKIISIMEEVGRSRIESRLVTINVEKAFDRLHWGFLRVVLERFRFPSDFVTAVFSLYHAPAARVSYAGFFSATFVITNGCRQGCPLSPLLYVLALEPLAELIRSTTLIQGFHFGSREVKLGLFADDIMLTLTDPIHSLPPFMDLLEAYSSVSYHKVNQTKTQALPLNIEKDGMDFLRAESGITTLGQLYEGGTFRTFEDLRSHFEPANIPIEKRNQRVAFKHSTSLASLRQRVASLQHQVSVLQKGKQAATASAKECKKEKLKLAAELHLAHQRLQISKQMAKKQSSDLTDFQREKEYLERAVEQMKEQLFQAKGSLEMMRPMTSDQPPVSPLTPTKSTDLEMKQLQCKLKNMTLEMAKQSAAMKSLKNEAQEKEERIREMQERAARMERDVSMKRHLIEDLKTRLKTYQENERPGKEMLESLERKVKALTEECSHKKTSIDSLKQRLSVATKEKAQYEQMYHKVREDLEKKNLKVSDLEVKVSEAERAVSELEATATQQLRNLAGQSEQALEVVQNKLLHVNRRAEELVTFVKILAKELQLNICNIRSQIRQARSLQEANSGPSKESVHRAQSLAASILNISCTDLDEILDVQDDEEIANMERSVASDKEWMNYIMKLLEGQLPFASNLMEAVLSKLNEKKELIEEYTLLKRDTRE
ncbi:centlein [Rhinophrynus dorsalis]